MNKKKKLRYLFRSVVGKRTYMFVGTSYFYFCLKLRK